MRKIFIPFSLFLVLSVVPSLAQQKEETYNEKVIVTGDYKPVLDETPKLLVAPAIVDTGNTLQHKFTYDGIQARRLTSIFEPARIKAARVVGEPRPRLYNNYLRIGMGNYWTPLFEGYFNSLADRKWVYGASLSHHSSWGTIGDKDDAASYFGPNHFSQTGLSLFARYNLDEFTNLSTSLTYENDYNLYYGFCDTTLDAYENRRHGYAPDSVTGWRDAIAAKDYRATYNRIAWSGGFKKMPRTGLQWSVDVNVADLWSNHGHNEFQAGAAFLVSHPFSVAKSFDMKLFLKGTADLYVQRQELANMPLGYAADSADDETVKHVRPLFVLNPFATFSVAGFNVHAGFAVSFNGYSKTYTLTNYFFPDVTVGRSFLDETLVVTAGVVGSEKANTWNSMRLLNPYVMLCDDLRTVRQYSFFAQGHYKMSKKLHLNLKASYNLFYDYLTFQLDPRFELRNVFMPKYESFSQFVLKGDFAFINDEMFTLELGGTYYKGAGIAGDTLPGLYHPMFDAHLNIHLNYNDIILVHIQGLLLSKLNAAYAYDPRQQKNVITETLPMRYGVNLEVEYRHNRALSFFLKADNLAFQRYYYWQNYPSQKALFMLGLTYTLH